MKTCEGFALHTPQVNKLSYPGLSFPGPYAIREYSTNPQTLNTMFHRHCKGSLFQPELFFTSPYETFPHCGIYASKAIVIAHSADSRICSATSLKPDTSSLVRPPVPEAGRLASHHTHVSQFNNIPCNISSLRYSLRYYSLRLCW